MTALAPFSTACGQLRPLRLAVEHIDGGRVAEGELDQPFALIGSGDGCEITLNHPDVSARVACLQVLDGAVFVVALADFALHHLTPESPFTVGPFVLRLFGSPADSPLPIGDPLRDPVSGRQLPNVQLLFRGATPPRELDRRWTFLGLPRLARSVEGVAYPVAYVVLTSDGPFVVDLLAAGTKVNGSTVRMALLADGDELIVGHDDYTVAVGHPDPVWQGTASLSSVAGALLGGPSSDSEDAEVEEYVPLVPSRVPDPTDPTLAAVSRKWGELQSLLFSHFRQKVDDLLADFGSIRREQLVDLRNELARLSDGPPDGAFPGVTTLPAQPVGLPAFLPPQPTDDGSVNDETAAVHQAVYDRLLSLEQERQGLWKRMRGLLGG